jgi:hypothetical protein
MMRTLGRWKGRGVALSLWGAFGFPLSAQAYPGLVYDVIDLTSKIRPGVIPVAIDEAGQQVALTYAESPFASLSYLWSTSEPDHPILVQAPAGGVHLKISSVNRDGVFSAIGADSGGAPHAYRVLPGGQVEDWGAGTAYAVDAQGSLYGSVTDAKGTRGVAWSTAGQAPLVLPALDGGLPQVRQASASGALVGWSYSESGAGFHAALWSRSGSGWSVRDLGTLGGTSSYGLGISPSGEFVVGWSYGQGAVRQAQAFIASGTSVAMRPLEPAGSSQRSVARAVNDAGWVVGDVSGKAVIWIEGKSYSLRDLMAEPEGWTLGEAKAINSRGDVLVLGMRQGQARALLLKKR